MSAKELRIWQHEARWALQFLRGSVMTEPGCAELRKKLEAALQQPDKVAIDLSGDELELCVQGYEQLQTGTLWIEGVRTGEGIVKDREPTFSPEKTELYHRMKKALSEEEAEESQGS
jgi:hypothetical protein